MLERATACLKVGARDSLHCAQRAPRSRRSLHSTFWNHGASEIELPSWAVEDPPMQGENARSGDNGRARKSRHMVKESDATAPAPLSQTDGVFLDFLYPPQALAWMHRSNGQSRERWERRNARRLPEGFVQASRRYSSRSAVRKAESTGAADDDLIEFVPIDTSSPAADQSASSQTPRAALRMMRELKDEQITAPDEPLPFEDTVIGARDAVEVVPEESRDTIVPLEHEFTPVQNPLEVLRRAISGKGLKTVSALDIRRNWFLYQSLDEHTKEDWKLKHELLLYMAKLNDETAISRAKYLFSSMPVEARSLSDYEAATLVNLRDHDYEGAFEVHRLALRSIPNGHQITKGFFKYAMQQRQWQHAVTIKKDHDEMLSGAASSSNKELFWLHVVEMSDLIGKAAGFVGYYNDLVRSEPAECRRISEIGTGPTPSQEQALALCNRLCEEAMRQILTLPYKDDDDPQITKIYQVLEHMKTWHPEAPRLFLEFIKNLLERYDKKTYRQAHKLVSRLYNEYRSMDDFRPSQQLLESLLERLLPFSLNIRDPKPTTNNITFQMIVDDITRHHSTLSCWATKELLNWHARQGLVDKVREYFMYLQQHYPKYEDQEDALSSLIYVFARRGEPSQARAAFEEVQALAKKNGADTQLKWWNILLHACDRGNDLNAALEYLERLIVDTNLTPDVMTFHPVLELLALRGDVEGIESMFEQYGTLNGGPHQTSFVGSYMRALVRSGEIVEAENVLNKAIPKVRSRKILGSLTTCFNILLVAYARQRNIDATMRVYRWMKDSKIRLDVHTFSALMLALVVYRQTDAAATIMNVTMKQDGLQPTAIHYAIAMNGFIQQRQYSKAIKCHTTMFNNRVRPSLSTRRLYLHAKAHLEAKKYRGMRTPEGAPLALTDIINELRDAVGETDRSEMASKDPFFNPGGGDELLSSFASIIFIHGKRRCMEAVQLLLTVYKDMQDYSEEGHLPMRVISALMNAHLEFKDYPAVAEYLELAIAEADRITALMPVPNFVLLASEKEDSAEDVAKKDRRSSTPDHEAIGAEVGFPAGVPSSSPPAVPAAATTDVVNDPTVAPGLDYILSTPLTYQIKAVAAQNRITTILGTFTSLVRRGYVFDAITWNTLVQALCASDPPLVLLAFTLTERFLIDQFAGWTTSRGERNYRPRPEPKRSGLQYMRARYLPFDRLVPHYKTMVHLASAFTKLQTIETMGGVNDIPDVVRFVGTVKKVEESAPKTMMAIRELPVVRSDRLQQRLLSREDGW